MHRIMSRRPLPSRCRDDDRGDRPCCWLTGGRDDHRAAHGAATVLLSTDGRVVTGVSSVVLPLDVRSLRIVGDIRVSRPVR